MENWREVVEKWKMRCDFLLRIHAKFNANRSKLRSNVCGPRARSIRPARRSNRGDAILSLPTRGRCAESRCGIPHGRQSVVSLSFQLLSSLIRVLSQLHSPKDSAQRSTFSSQRSRGSASEREFIFAKYREKPLTILFVSLSNAKPSAIFRLRGTINPSTTVSPFASYAPAANSLGTSNLVANLGISIEPLEAVEAQVNALAASSSSTQLVVHKPALDPVELAARIAQNLFNFVSSGVELPGDLLRKWLEIFQGKLKTRGVAFLQSD